MKVNEVPNRGTSMTREEQIKKQANIYIGHPQDLGEDIIITNMRNAFIDGAKWVDEHPNFSEEEQVGMGGLGMTWQKKALIEKACKWLKNELFEDKAEFNPYYVTDVKSKSYDTLNQFIENFKKAMEQ